MKNPKFFVLVAICLALFSCTTKGPTPQDLLKTIPNPKTLNETYVSNPDQLLSQVTVDELNAKLIPLDDAGIAHIDVVFVNSIGQNIPKEFAHELFKTWQIGDKAKNNGLLILMVKDQRRMEFETGDGLEGVLPDVVCYQIQQEYMVPYAKNGDFDRAVLSGVDALITRLKREEGISSTPHNAEVPVPLAIDTTLQPPTIVPEMVEPDRVGLKMAEPDVVEPYGLTAAPRADATAATTNKVPGALGGWISLIILAIYYALAKKTANGLTANRYKGSVNPIFWLLLIVPIGGVILLDLYVPVSWMEIRQVTLLYLFLLLYIQLHFWILTWRFSSTLKGLDNHAQYLKWQETHARMYWANRVFPYPFFKAYWKKYQDRQQLLRDTPMACTNCDREMTRLTEEQDDHYLSKGQVAEEQINAVDYDVWYCKACKEKLILDYQNILSEATECSNCHFKTRVYKGSQIIQRATTLSEGSGYMLYVCKNCNYNDKVLFTIARISTSSGGSSSRSSSSSSSSSSSRSSSSGGSSSGGGAGSSW